MKLQLTTEVGSPSNDGAFQIEQGVPYTGTFEVVGVAPFLFHRWSVEDVEAKGKAAKGSRGKKEDNLEAYVYRDTDGRLAIPNEYFRMTIINAAKYKQDPRSPRKSAMDLFKAGLANINEYCNLGLKEWQYVDRRRVVIQRNGITRSRPALHVGWKCEVAFEVLLPEYISPELLNETMQSGGRLVGVGDFRPSFGRYQVTRFRVSQ
jgi:hypothetical protein